MSFQIPYSKQNVTEEDIESVVKVLKSEFLTQGPCIAEFEQKFARYIGSKYAIAVSNGTAALHLALLAHGIKAGDAVISTPITFSATVNAALYLGAKVHFADIDPDSYLISVESVLNLLSSHPPGYFKAIIPVDFGGHPVNLEIIRNIAIEHGLFVLEDACHAPGAYFTDSLGLKQWAGNCAYADAAVFSFHSVKHIACGEGGMVTTNDQELYRKISLLRTHGITKDPKLFMLSKFEQNSPWYYEMQELGFNYRITDIQAALGLSQLNRAEEGIKKRQVIAERYKTAFQSLGIKIQFTEPTCLNAYHLFVLEVDRREELYHFLRDHGIFSQVHYIPVHLMPFYQSLGWKIGDLPKAEAYYERCLSLPMYPSLSHTEQEYVISKVTKFYEK